MCSRSGDTPLISSLRRARQRCPLEVVRVVRPAQFDERTWGSSLRRLEELGIFPGQVVERTGAPGSPGAVILRAGGSRVTLSRELAASVFVRPCLPGRKT